MPTVFAWGHEQLHVYMSAQKQIDLGEQKITCAGRFYLPPTARVKQDVVAEDKHILSCCFR